MCAFRMPKGEAEKLIDTIYREKAKKKRDAVALEKYVGEFLTQKFGMPEVVAEWGYNLLAAAVRNSYDADCRVFTKVLRGELPESIIQDQVELCANIVALGRKLDKAHAGTCKFGAFVEKLQQFFLHKTAQNERDLVDALEAQIKVQKAIDGDSPLLGDELLEYERLFEEDRERNQGPFAEALRSQYIAEREDVVAALSHALDEKNPPAEELQPAAVATILKSLLWHKPAAFRLSILTFAFGAQNEKELKSKSLPCNDEFMKRVRPFLERKLRSELPPPDPNRFGFPAPE